MTLNWARREDTGADACASPASLPLPEVPMPPHRLLAQVDEEGLRRLVGRHLQRLALSPLGARLHRPDGSLEALVERVGDFVVESCGGARRRVRHGEGPSNAGLPLVMNETDREVWLVNLWHAFEDIDFPADLREDFWGWAEPLSVHMLAPHARTPAVRRLPFALVRAWFADGATS